MKVLYYLLLSRFIILQAIVPGTMDEFPSLGQFKVVLDANWRWLHYNNSYQNCFEEKWLCGNDCNNCVLEGVTKDQYNSIYGISNNNNELELQFIKGNNVGSRLYLLENNKYWLPNLLNKQISIDIDVSELPCSLNAAVYLVQMNSTKLDTFGIGYGDAQCPTDIKYFYTGEVNKNREPICSVEIDLIEANSEALAWTLHPCDGNNCDKNGADANSYRQGFHDFYGKGKIIDTNKPFRVITQFIGDPLYEVKRFYQQSNNLVEHPGGSLTSDSIQNWKNVQQEVNTFESAGGFMSLTYAIKQGMGFIVSLWDDQVTHMKWLDSDDRGPCHPNFNIRQSNPTAKVRFSNIKLEDIINYTNNMADNSIKTQYDHENNLECKNNLNQNYCCFAAENNNDFCNTCYSSAKALSDTWCGQSEEKCKGCSSTAVWCN
jgi:cellulose 1,4-beta-cellobiosidase